jgi:hypothetical protein
MNFAAKLLPPRWSAAANSQVLIGCARLTLVSLSAVVSANLRIEFKREGWAVQELHSAALFSAAV